MIVFEGCSTEIATLYVGCAALPARRRRQLAAADLAHWLVMALDGYAIHHHLNPRAAVSDATLEVVTAMILGAPVARRAGAGRGKK